MTPFPAGRSRSIEFDTNYSSLWTVTNKAGTPVLAADVSSAKFMVKKRLGTPDATALITKTSTAGGITLADGKATVTLIPADTAGLQGKYYGTLTLFLTSGSVLDWQDNTAAQKNYLELEFSQGAVEATS